jgi:hypothetical protein
MYICIASYKEVHDPIAGSRCPCFCAKQTKLTKHGIFMYTGGPRPHRRQRLPCFCVSAISQPPNLNKRRSSMSGSWFVYTHIHTYIHTNVYTYVYTDTQISTRHTHTVVYLQADTHAGATAIKGRRKLKENQKHQSSCKDWSRDQSFQQD